MRTTVKVRVIRPLMHDAERVECGAVLEVDAGEAAALLDSGRACLVDELDAAAVTAERTRLVAAAVPPVPANHYGPGSPWIRGGR